MVLWSVIVSVMHRLRRDQLQMCYTIRAGALLLRYACSYGRPCSMNLTKNIVRDMSITKVSL